MTTTTLPASKPAATTREIATRTPALAATAPRMARSWFKVEGQLECRLVEA